MKMGTIAAGAVVSSGPSGECSTEFALHRRRTMDLAHPCFRERVGGFFTLSILPGTMLPGKERVSSPSKGLLHDTFLIAWGSCHSEEAERPKNIFFFALEIIRVL